MLKLILLFFYNFLEEITNKLYNIFIKALKLEVLMLKNNIMSFVQMRNYLFI